MTTNMDDKELIAALDDAAKWLATSRFSGHEINSIEVCSVVCVAKERLEALQSPADAGVVVKALDWVERVGVSGTFDAETSIGHFIATITDDERGMWFLVGQTGSNYCQPDIEAVKAAAQADYERRILSALEGEGHE